MTPRRAVELHAGARILTNHGLLLVMHLERHGARVQDALGVMSSIFYDAVIAAQVGDGAVQAVHSSLEPWWSGLTVDTRANALFRQEVVLEVLTGYRDGHPELAYDGEPFFPFGTGYGTSIRQRCDAMAEQVSFERSVDRAVMRRVREAELVTGRMARQSIQRWVTAWRHEGLRGLVDGRKTKGSRASRSSIRGSSGSLTRSSPHSTAGSAQSTRRRSSGASGYGSSRRASPTRTCRSA